MGWTSYRINKRETIDQTLRQEFTQSSQGGARSAWDVMHSATVGAVWYAAMRRTDYDTSTPDGSTRERVTYYGMVCLTERRTPKGSDRTEFAYKDMDESMLPFYFDCPARILDFLDTHAPVTEGNALAWRARCRQRLAEKNQRNKERKQAHQQARARLQAFIRDHVQIIHIKV
jgi:hypothetical protein